MARPIKPRQSNARRPKPLLRSLRPACAEQLERRDLLSGVSLQSAPLFVRDVYVSGSAWTQPFKDYLPRGGGASSAAYGFPVHAGYGPANPSLDLRLPWVNIDRISVGFSDDVRVEADDLKVRGVNVPLTAASSVTYQFDTETYTGTATWLFDRPLRVDRVVVDLDAGPDGVKLATIPTPGPLDGDYNGVAGGDFHLRLNVLPGGAASVIGGHGVSSYDVSFVRTSLATSPFESRQRQWQLFDVVRLQR